MNKSFFLQILLCSLSIFLDPSRVWPQTEPGAEEEQQWVKSRLARAVESISQREGALATISLGKEDYYSGGKNLLENSSFFSLYTTYGLRKVRVKNVLSGKLPKEIYVLKLGNWSSLMRLEDGKLEPVRESFLGLVKGKNYAAWLVPYNTTTFPDKKIAAYMRKLKQRKILNAPVFLPAAPGTAYLATKSPDREFEFGKNDSLTLSPQLTKDLAVLSKQRAVAGTQPLSSAPTELITSVGKEIAEVLERNKPLERKRSGPETAEAGIYPSCVSFEIEPPDLCDCSVLSSLPLPEPAFTDPVTAILQGVWPTPAEY